MDFFDMEMFLKVVVTVGEKREAPGAPAIVVLSLYMFVGDV
jgi:hypothetical protein